MGIFSKAVSVSIDEKKIDELLLRGVENVIPRDLASKKLSSGEKLRVYLGIDPTGAKLHLGHSVPLRKLKAFSDLGHHVIFVVGSFTAMIGDPTGRDAAREPLTPEQVRENFQNYKRQAQKILDFSKVEIRYNDEWLSPLKFNDIVKLASNFTVQQMLQRDMFEKRIGEGKPISLHEFLYPLMVGYDSVTLDVDVELGGSDQEFNMLAGRHLQSRMGKREKFVLTTKLIEGTDGRKMSKTYNNCVYLEDEPSDMFGKTMSIKDELIRTYFEVLTDLSKQQIEEIMHMHPKESKMRLGHELVSMYHDKDAAAQAQGEWESTFSKGEVPTDAPEVGAGKLHEFVTDVSKSELRRLVDQGAVSSVISGEKITSIDQEITNDVIRIGKHRFYKVK
ncbi:MAG: tyrosine--tRNA ligase [Patescibacteria group bacterium]